MEKTTVFNLIILDESGSMSPVTNQTVAGCNETLNVIRSLEKKHGETQRNLVSIYVFQENEEVPSRYLCKNKPIGDVKDVTTKDYQPWGCTPLLDAVGQTLVDLKMVAETHPDATGIVTIITDGYENASREYTWKQVASLITELKEKGWTFNFIGANIDVEEVSKRMNIDNKMAFQASQAGTKAMFDSFSADLMAHEDARVMEEMACPGLSETERREMRKKLSKNFFRH